MIGVVSKREREKLYKQYVKEDAEISLVKEAGATNSKQKFVGTKCALLTLLASALNTLLTNKILTEADVMELGPTVLEGRRCNYEFK